MTWDLLSGGGEGYIGGGVEERFSIFLKVEVCCFQAHSGG